MHLNLCQVPGVQPSQDTRRGDSSQVTMGMSQGGPPEKLPLFGLAGALGKETDVGAGTSPRWEVARCSQGGPLKSHSQVSTAGALCGSDEDKWTLDAIRPGRNSDLIATVSPELTGSGEMNLR